MPRSKIHHGESLRLISTHQHLFNNSLLFTLILYKTTRKLTVQQTEMSTIIHTQEPPDHQQTHIAFFFFFFFLMSSVTPSPYVAV